MVRNYCRICRMHFDLRGGKSELFSKFCKECEEKRLARAELMKQSLQCDTCGFGIEPGEQHTCYQGDEG